MIGPTKAPKILQLMPAPSWPAQQYVLFVDRDHEDGGYWGWAEPVQMLALVEWEDGEQKITPVIWDGDSLGLVTLESLGREEYSTWLREAPSWEQVVESVASAVLHEEMRRARLDREARGQRGSARGDVLAGLATLGALWAVVTVLALLLAG